MPKRTVRTFKKKEVLDILNNKNAVLTIHILRNWKLKKIESFARHLLGDSAQTVRTFKRWAKKQDLKNKKLSLGQIVSLLYLAKWPDYNTPVLITIEQIEGKERKE